MIRFAFYAIYYVFLIVFLILLYQQAKLGYLQRMIESQFMDDFQYDVLDYLLEEN